MTLKQGWFDFWRSKKREAKSTLMAIEDFLYFLLTFSVQMSFYKRLREKKVASKFFRAIIAKLQAAQNRLKSEQLSGSSGRTKSGGFWKEF